MDKPPENVEKITRGGFFSDLFFCDAYTILNVQINLIEIISNRKHLIWIRIQYLICKEVQKNLMKNFRNILKHIVYQKH